MLLYLMFHRDLMNLKLKWKAKIRIRYNQIHVSLMNQDTVWESDKTQENALYKRANRPALFHQVIT